MFSSLAVMFVVDSSLSNSVVFMHPMIFQVEKIMATGWLSLLLTLATLLDRFLLLTCATDEICSQQRISTCLGPWHSHILGHGLSLTKVT